MKKILIILGAIIFASCVFIRCDENKSSSTQSCSESEAFAFAKKSIQAAPMEIGASNTISSSNENCEYSFYFEGRNRYYECQEATITVNKTNNEWKVIDCKFKSCK
ncbi:MAG: hypothetical protein WCL51_13000 [Bacteroidota bacterium]